MQEVLYQSVDPVRAVEYALGDHGEVSVLGAGPLVLVLLAEDVYLSRIYPGPNGVPYRESPRLHS